MESNTNNFHTEKLQLIQLLLNTESPNIIKEVRKLLTQSSPAPLSKKEIISRSNESEKAIREGDTLSIDELKQESKNW